MRYIPHTPAVREAEMHMHPGLLYTRSGIVNSTGHRVAGWWRNPKTGEWGIMQTSGTYMEWYSPYAMSGKRRAFTYVADRHGRRVERVEIDPGGAYYGGDGLWHPVLT